MTFLAAALLGIVQGVTEFLPVSSSAHLILAREFFGWNGEQFGLPFDVACHVGTLAALLAYFHRDLSDMLRAVPHMLKPSRSQAARLAWQLVIATVPIGMAGLFYGSVEARLRTPAVAAAALAAGGLVLLLVERVGRRYRGVEDLHLSDALIIGIAQALALIPGVSRSGATITAAMFLGLRREAAARFAFLLGIIAIVAAASREALPVLHELHRPGSAQLFLIGVVTSGAVGYVVVKYLMRYLGHHSLDAFAYYRLELAAAAGLWLWRH